MQYTYTNTDIYTLPKHTYSHTHIHTYTHSHAYTHAYIYTQTYTHIHTHMYTIHLRVVALSTLIMHTSRSYLPN